MSEKRVRALTGSEDSCRVAGAGAPPSWILVPQGEAVGVRQNVGLCLLAVLLFWFSVEHLRQALGRTLQWHPLRKADGGIPEIM